MMTRIPTVLLAGALATGCGSRPRADSTPVNPDADPVSLGGTACTTNAECPNGVCSTDGFCDNTAPEAPTTCLEHADCDNNAYCHFTPSGEVWQPGTSGLCSAPCLADDECTVGQECIGGRCYTNLSCDPANNHIDCPPGHVCNTQSRSCTAPPSQCRFAEQCPEGWVCNTDHSCMDPAAVNLGGCTSNLECELVAGCEGNTCSCHEGACRPILGCTAASECGLGNYCANGACRPAAACTIQDNCTPYGLVCTANYCVNPNPCTTPDICPNGQICHDNFNPPACFPDETAQCVRDEQCTASQFCELFSGRCQAGCRDNYDCQACGNAVTQPAYCQCPAGSAQCSCDSAHACVPRAISDIGDTCDKNEDCPGGTKCAVDQPGMNGLACQLGGMFGFPIPGCTKSCRVVCDTLVGAIVNTCPPGQVCGSGDLFQDLIAVIFTGALTGAAGGETTASVCYEPTP